jgi:hypothetical protein
MLYRPLYVLFLKFQLYSYFVSFLFLKFSMVDISEIC